MQNLRGTWQYRYATETTGSGITGRVPLLKQQVVSFFKTENLMEIIVDPHGIVRYNREILSTFTPFPAIVRNILQNYSRILGPDLHVDVVHCFYSDFPVWLYS